MKVRPALIMILVVAMAGVTGRGVVHASSGQFTTIDAPNAVFPTVAGGINSQGDIVGSYFDRITHTFRGFLLSHG